MNAKKAHKKSPKYVYKPDLSHKRLYNRTRFKRDKTFIKEWNEDCNEVIDYMGAYSARLLYNTIPLPL